VVLGRMQKRPTDVIVKEHRPQPINVAFAPYF
jgi:hypothetical protein